MTQTDKLNKVIKSKGEKQAEVAEIIEEPIKESPKISQDTLDKLLISMDEQQLSPERKKAALEYYKVKKFADMTEEQGHLLAKQLKVAL